jgi:deazaflavin-dependent oxidoreductase (nitroreductase family)
MDRHGIDLAVNRGAKWLTAHGVSLLGSRILQVRGRRSGQPRTTLVNVLEFQGDRYLVAPRGQTQWARNLRAAREGELRIGRRVERFVAVELTDDEKPDLLRAYLKRWWFEVGRFFQGVGPKAPIEDIRRIAPLHPVFRLSLEDERVRPQLT